MQTCFISGLQVNRLIVNATMSSNLSASYIDEYPHLALRLEPAESPICTHRLQCMSTAKCYRGCFTQRFVVNAVRECTIVVIPSRAVTHMTVLCLRGEVHLLGTAWEHHNTHG